MGRKLWLVVPWCLLLAFVSWTLMRERPLVFANLSTAKTNIAASGYHCTSDRQDGKFEFGFMVTRVPTTWHDVGGVLKIGSLPSEWQGKVWIAQINDKFQLLSTPAPEAADVRIWGNLIAFGDRAFLDELESTLRRHS
jgi:hypothetical protein